MVSFGFIIAKSRVMTYRNHIEALVHRKSVLEEKIETARAAITRLEEKTGQKKSKKFKTYKISKEYDDEKSLPRAEDLVSLTDDLERSLIEAQERISDLEKVEAAQEQQRESSRSQKKEHRLNNISQILSAVVRSIGKVTYYAMFGSFIGFITLACAGFPEIGFDLFAGIFLISLTHQLLLSLKK